jgi:hypothetical protein
MLQAYYISVKIAAPSVFSLKLSSGKHISPQDDPQAQDVHLWGLAF